MAKVSKNAMKVKGVIKNYVATWTYAVPLAQWSREALVANIDLGIKYAVKQKIKAQVLDDERTVKRSAGILAGMLRLANGDKEQLAIVAEICKAQNIRTEIQLEYVIHENGYMTAPEVVESDEDDEDLDDLEDLEDDDDSDDSEDSPDVEESDEVTVATAE